MPVVQDSPGLISLPKGESAQGVHAPVANVDRSFIDYGKEPLKGLKSASKVILDYREREKKKMQESMASDLVNQYYIRSMEHLVGENGALLMKEQDVAKGVDGKSYTDYHTGELDKVEAELLSGASPEVAQYATEKIRTLRRGFVGQLFNHEGQELWNYDVTTHKTSIAVATDGVSNGSNIGGGYGAIYSNLAYLADKNGQNVNDPKVKSLLRAEARKKYSQAVSQRVEYCLAHGDPARATDAIQSAWRVGGLTGDMNEALQEKVGAYVRAQDVNAYASQIVTDFEREATPSSALLYAVGGDASPWLDRFEDKDSKFTWAREGLSPTEKKARDVDVMERAITEFGGVKGAAIALSFDSPERLKEAQEAAEQKYKGSVSPQHLVEFMKPNEKSKLTRVENAYLARKESATNVTDSQIFAKATAFAGGDTKLAAEISLAAKQGRAVKEAEREVIRTAEVQKLVNQVDSGSVDLTQINLNALTPEQRSAAQLLIHTASIKAPVSDSRLFSDLFFNPSKLCNLGEADFMLLRGRLSPNEWAQLDSQRRFLLGNGGPSNGAVNTGWVNMAIDRYIARHPGIDFSDGTDEGRARKAALRVVAVDAVRARMMTGAAAKAPLTQADYEEVVDSVLSTQFRMPPGFFLSGRDVSLANLNAKDIPDPAKALLGKAFGVDPDSLEDVHVQNFAYMLMYDPRVDIDPNAIPPSEREEIVRTYMKHNPGATGLDIRAIGRLAFLKRLGDIDRYSESVGVKVVNNAPKYAEAAEAYRAEVGEEWNSGE